METVGNDKFVDTDDINSDEANNLKDHTGTNNGNEVRVPKQYNNRRSLDKGALTYKLESFEKNMMLIFNQIKCPGKAKRLGTEKDVEALTECFEKLRFEVQTHDDCTKEELFDKLDKVTSQDLSDYGCFAIVILTHGSEYGMLLTKNTPIFESEIIKYMMNSETPSLVTKPKLLIVQACRGSNYSKSVQVTPPELKPSTSVGTDNISSPSGYTLPAPADLLIFHSTFPGDCSMRHFTRGSWFIQSLCKFMNESKEEDDFGSIVILVKNYVSINHQQMPVITDTLTRKLYFKIIPAKTLTIEFKQFSIKVNNAMKKGLTINKNLAGRTRVPMSEIKTQFMHKRRTPLTDKAQLQDLINYAQEKLYKT